MLQHRPDSCRLSSTKVLTFGQLCLAALALGWPLVSVAESAEPLASQFTDRTAFNRFVAQGWDSPFGLDYVFVHNPGARDRKLIDGCCQSVPVRWVNLSDLQWRTVEPKPPVEGRHIYKWFDLDEAIRAWQRNGVHALVSLRFNSPWATVPKTDKEFVYLQGIVKRLVLASSDYLPKPEHMQDFRDYVRSLVERYDGDGMDDMSGLLFPVLHYQVGNEFYNEVFWAGSVEEYGQLLREFAHAARAACPSVKIVLSGIGWKDVYDFYDREMDPRTAAYVRGNLLKVPPGMQKFLDRSEAFSRTSLGFTDAYDILDARWPNYGYVVRSRELLREAGCADRPIWSAEIYSGFRLMEPLVLQNTTLHASPTPSRSPEYLAVLKNKNDPRFQAINAWYRGLQAAQVVKICMVGLHADSRMLMIGWAVDAQHPLAVSGLSHHGLYSITFGYLWPAGYTYGLTIRKLEGLRRIERLPMPPYAYVYRCERTDGTQVLVAFCDDHIGQNHDEPTATLRALVPVSASRVQVTHILKEIGQTQPRVERLPVHGDGLQLTLTEYPVFIEPFK